MSTEELSELQTIDIFFGKWISEAFTPLKKTAGPVQFREFLNRPVARQIYRTFETSPMDFLKALESGGNPVEMPVCFYSRTPGITNGESRYLTDKTAKWDKDALSYLKFAMMPVTLTYQVFFLAWDLLSLDKLQLAFYAHRQANYRFAYHCVIGEESRLTEIDARITNHKEITFMDMSANLSAEKRVYSVSTEVIIDTHAIIGSSFAVKSPLRIELKWVGFSCGGEDARFEPLPAEEPETEPAP